MINVCDRISRGKTGNGASILSMLLGEEMRVRRKSDFNCIQMKQNPLLRSSYMYSLVYVHISYLQREFMNFSASCMSRSCKPTSLAYHLC